MHICDIFDVAHSAIAWQHIMSHTSKRSACPCGDGATSGGNGIHIATSTNNWVLILAFASMLLCAYAYSRTAYVRLCAVCTEICAYPADSTHTHTYTHYAHVNTRANTNSLTCTLAKRLNDVLPVVHVSLFRSLTFVSSSLFFLSI